MISWYVIDEHGAHPVPVHHATAPAGWPAFAQLALRCPIEDAHAIVRDIVGEPSHWGYRHELAFARHLDWTLLDEPGVDLDARQLTPASAEHLARSLQCDATFLLNDPSLGLLHLSLFEGGELQLQWEDATSPLGPSLASTFHADGRCTHEDPRRFALEALNLPEDTPLLDRYAFIEFMLHGVGQHVIAPNLEGVEISRTLELRDLND